jgi:hypothetical protein
MSYHETVKKFVKQTLGCVCPDEVFLAIESLSNIKVGNDISLRYKLNIGNRLLIYVICSDDIDFVLNNLPLLVSAGKNERDRRSLNRLRIVIATENIKKMRSSVQARFNDCARGDEKIYLHIVHHGDVEL